MTALRFICPECREPLLLAERSWLCPNGHVFKTYDGVHHLLPISPSVLTVQEGHYHAEQKETWIELNQVDTLRNAYFHRSLLQFIAQHSTPASRIMEVAGGVGFDLKLFLNMNAAFQEYVFTEVSHELAEYVAQGIKSEKMVFCTADAAHIPFANEEFDFVFLVAALHHMPDVELALEEMIRVTKTKGFICLGIEPNTCWLRLFSKGRSFFRKVLPKKEHSEADEHAAGFSLADFERFANSSGVRLVYVDPVWFICGFVHYGLEFIYRLFRLSKRIQLPLSMERILVRVDLILLRIPIIKGFSWHYNAVYQKL